MLKIMGSVCILIAAVGGSIGCMRRLREQERQLLAIKEMLVTLENQMEYVGLPMVDLLRELAEKTGEPFDEMLMEFLEYLDRKQVERLSVLWREILLRRRKEYVLNREEFEILMDMGRLLEPTDGKSQIASIELYKSRIDERIRKMWEERAGKQKVYQSICLMGGLVLIIILL